MAINKNSTGYTVTFAVILVGVCGFLLAVLSQSLKVKQNANVDNEKRQFIIAAAGEMTMDSLKQLTHEQVSEIYNSRIVGKVLNASSEEIDANAFAIDIVKEFKSTKGSEENRKFPFFEYTNGNVKKFIVPMAGNGLWGPVWGYVALSSDKNTISGVVFDHKSETPGLGAKITEASFTDKFTTSQKTIVENGKYFGIKVVKGDLKNPTHEIDAIAGATITSKGVGEMLERSFKTYMKYWGLTK